REEGRLVLRIPQSFARHRLERRRADLEAVCARLFGRPTRVELAAPADADAAGAASASADEAVRRRRRDALAHPSVNAVLEIFGGEVVEIRPHGSRGDGGATR
ncbi:MAG: hypothetical protein DCC71_22995, partial [Proteobacteria bacterium]